MFMSLRELLLLDEYPNRSVCWPSGGHQLRQQHACLLVIHFRLVHLLQQPKRGIGDLQAAFSWRRQCNGLGPALNRKQWKIANCTRAKSTEVGTAGTVF